MFKILVPFVALAAASAPAVTLTPVSLSGCVHTQSRSSYHSGYGPGGNPNTFRTTLTNDLYTQSHSEAGSYYGWLHHSDVWGVIGTYQNSMAQGWMAEFDLPTLPSGMVLASATLSATVTGGSNPAQPVGVHVYRGDGVVRTGDWTSAALSSTFGTAVVGPYLADVTGGVRSLYALGGRGAGLRVQGGGEIMRWSSPTLTLTYAPVPEPASMAALGLGAVGLLHRRRS